MRKFHFRKFKRILKRVYELLFCDPYHRIKNRHNKPSIQHHTYDVRELFYQENDAEGFNRFDIIVRLLAIENYYGENDFGWDLYRKQQNIRKGSVDYENAESRFLALIKSYEEKGYDKTSNIQIGSDLRIWDGSHRIALAMYHKQYQIFCEVMPSIWPIYYGIKWYIENDFSLAEIAKIQKRYVKLKEDIQVPFVCTLWAPVAPFYDEIVDRLKLIYKVVSYTDYSFDEYNYAQMARKIYAVDDIEKWKIEKKIEYMRQNVLNDQWRIRVVKLQIDRPRFRRKDSNQNTLSQECEDIKRIIRNCYKDKLPNYYHDIICHIGDNFYQNVFIDKLFQYYQNEISKNVVKTANIDFLYSIIEFKIDLLLNNIPLDDVCVVGSSILAAYEIRKNNDVDFVMSSSCRKRFLSKGVVPFSKNVEMVSENWARSKDKDFITDDELITNPRYHFVYMGIRFANLDILLERKMWQGREKDIEDVELIMSYISKKPNYKEFLCKQ